MILSDYSLQLPVQLLTTFELQLKNFLTELKIRRYTVAKGRRPTIKLHDRINLLPDKYAHFKETILAVKWLGNAGSHGNGVAKDMISKDDVLDYL